VYPGLYPSGDKWQKNQLLQCLSFNVD